MSVEDGFVRSIRRSFRDVPFARSRPTPRALSSHSSLFTSQSFPTTDSTKMFRLSASRRSEPSLTYPLLPSGNSRIVGNDCSERFSLAHSFSSPSARNFMTSTFLFFPFLNSAAAASNPSTIAWQNGHHGAYNTASVVEECVDSFRRTSMASRSTRVTDPSTNMSSSVASRFSCLAFSSAVMFPLCRPHSFMALSSHHHLPSRSCCPGSTARVHGAHPMET
mmetsp:Transcript_9183/g.38896  ORF Transcript_9183/g.38896 Transcript_9183/m.38896 type:complete len:221 (+) Transcript_9183:380-1042(+)